MNQQSLSFIENIEIIFHWTKLYEDKVNVFIDEEANIFQVYDLQRTQLFLFVKNPEENVSDGKKETVSVTIFKKWPFANEFRI